MEDKDFDEIRELLSQAHGEMHITIDGLVPHVTGSNLNTPGTIMACLAVLQTLKEVNNWDFEESIKMVRAINDLMSYEVVGNLNGKAAEKEEQNND